MLPSPISCCSLLVPPLLSSFACRRGYYYHDTVISQDTLELEGSVRSLTRRLITVANPLGPSESITFRKSGTEKDPAATSGDNSVSVAGVFSKETWWRCTSPHVRLVRVGEMAGNLEGVFAIEYRPLVPTQDNGKADDADLSFDIEELGTYRYELQPQFLRSNNNDRV